MEERKDSLDSLLAPYRAEVNLALSYLRESNQELARIASGFLGTGGKRIRPTVALLTCEAVSGSYKEALPIAVAYELAHSASLTQDDIIDNSATRHNKPTAHTKHGITTAILVSDLLIFMIFDQLAEYAEVDMSTESLASLTRYLGKAAKETAEGEYLEMQLSKKVDSKVEDYVKLAGLKTGALFGAAAASGAIVGGANQRTVRDMLEYGRNVGIAFQMSDDILDLTGSSQEMGKPKLKDVQNNASNIVIVHALAHSEPKRRLAIMSMMKRSAYGFVDADEVLTLLGGNGSVEFASDLGRKHAALARSKLKSLPEGKAKKTLEELTRWLEGRRR